MHLGKVWAIRDSKQVLTLPFLSFVCSFSLPPSFPYSTFPFLLSLVCHLPVCVSWRQNAFFSGRIPGLLNLLILLQILSDYLQAVCAHTRTHLHLYVSDNIFFPFPSQILFIHSLSSLVLFPSISRGNICFVPPFPLLPSIQNNKPLGFPISLITFPGDFAF